MRILIPNHFPLEGSGSGIYTQNIAREITRKGHKALAITPAHEKQRGYPFEVRSILFTPEDAERESGPRLPFNFPCFTTHPLSTATFGDLDDDQHQAYVQAFQTAIDSAVLDWNPDLIHAQHLWVTGYAALKAEMPYVVTAHGTDLMGFRKYEDWKEMALEGTQHAQTVIAISKQVARDAIELYGIPEERVRIVMNGFDENIFHVMSVHRSKVLARYGIPKEPGHLITFVGKLTEFKGVDVLLDAARIYERELGDVMTLIIGDGALRTQLEEQAKRLGLKGVHFLGHQPQPMVAEILNSADISTIPSRVEPFGLVAVEALACGTPVIATNEGGLPDFVDERVGALVDIDDSTALANAIISEIQSNSKEVKGPFAAAYALKDFSWSGQVDKMIEIYEEALQTG
ncbi:MAG: glycosyltransferase [Anaerolineales bacterium]|nr:glycosyltransferase [Anaerolineales bacterium]